MAETVDSIIMPLSEVLRPEEATLITSRLASAFPALVHSDHDHVRIRIEIALAADHG